MIKALIIANEFPPMGGSGIQRSSKFVKYLPSMNVEPIVITKAYVGTLRDDTLIKELPKNLKIHALKPFDLLHQKGLLSLPLKAIGRFLMIPDAEYLWQRMNRNEVLGILDAEKIDCVYTTSFPYSSHLLGLYLKSKRPSIRWVVDFRDEWTNNPYYADMPWMRFRLPFERRLEKQICEHCDFFITNTPFMLKNSLRDYPVLTDKSTFIPNGYDPEDFIPFDNKEKQAEKFTITYTGSLYGRRNLMEFFTALQNAINSKRISLANLEVRIVGNIAPDVLQGFKSEYQLGDSLVAYGYMTHHESIRKLYQSHVLLLSMGSGKGLENFYSGKVFEYIRVDRPILATVPEKGAAASVIRETRTGIVVDSENILGIEDALVDYYQQWTAGKIEHHPLWDAIEKYSRIQQTKQLAHHLTE
jgi:glycosyltransferase involved in cell wall biosynthesis